MRIVWVTKAEVKTRREICDSCEFKQQGLIDTCASCGCSLKAITLLRMAKCPKQKW